MSPTSRWCLSIDVLELQDKGRCEAERNYSRIPTPRARVLPRPPSLTCSTSPRGSLPVGWPSRAGTQSNWQKLRAPVFSPRRLLQLPARASPRAMAEFRSSSEAPLSACTSCTKCAAHAGSHFALLGATCGHARSERENCRCRRSVDVGLRREADEAFRLFRFALSIRDAACRCNFAHEICLNFVCQGKRPG